MARYVRWNGSWVLVDGGGGGGADVFPVDSAYPGQSSVHLNDILLWDGSEWQYIPSVPAFVNGDSGENQLNGSSALSVPVPNNTDPGDLVIVTLRADQNVVPSWTGTGGMTQEVQGLASLGGFFASSAVLIGDGFTGGGSITFTSANLSPGDYVGWSVASFENVSEIDFGTVFTGGPTAGSITVPGVTGAGIGLLIVTQNFGGDSGVTGFSPYTAVDASWGDGAGSWMYYLDDAEDPANKSLGMPQGSQPAVAWQAILS